MLKASHSSNLIRVPYIQLNLYHTLTFNLSWQWGSVEIQTLKQNECFQLPITNFPCSCNSKHINSECIRVYFQGESLFHSSIVLLIIFFMKDCCLCTRTLMNQIFLEVNLKVSLLVIVQKPWFGWQFCSIILRDSHGYFSIEPSLQKVLLAVISSNENYDQVCYHEKHKEWRILIRIYLLYGGTCDHPWFLVRFVLPSLKFYIDDL